MIQKKSIVKDFLDKNKKLLFIKSYTNSQSNNDGVATAIYLVGTAAAFVLSIFNLIEKKVEALILTSILFVTFLICYLLFFFLKKRLISDFIGVTVAIIIFTKFAIEGLNEGFAILWFVVFPSILTALDRHVAIIASAYLLAFIFVFCYSDIFAASKVLYTETFIERFPLLFLVCTLIADLVLLYKYNAEMKLAFSAFTDKLTGLYNRDFFEAVKTKIEKNEDEINYTTIVLDVNGLKAANDKYGHKHGDKLIKNAANCINNAFGNLKETVLVARVGGDEFTVILNEIDEETFNKQIELFKTDQKEKRIFIAYGVANLEETEYNFESAYNLADHRMYENKTQYYVANHINRRSDDRISS